MGAVERTPMHVVMLGTSTDGKYYTYTTTGTEAQCDALTAFSDKVTNKKIQLVFGTDAAPNDRISYF